ncbi:cysteine desulfurase [Patescibacteria group bacterium]|nr:cysteine desulfurase [Patescibacteria group bacterium]
MRKVYLDYAATTPVDPRVLKSMIPYFREIFANASSLHDPGQQAKKAMEEAREKVARLIKAEAEEIVFTSGGTEADNYALKGVFYAVDKSSVHIITSCIEHSAILKTSRFLEKQGVKITYLPVNKQGLVDPENITQAILPETILVSIMHANNEIGTIQPIKDMTEVVKAERNKRTKAKNNLPIYFHTDAVQTFGHVPIDVVDLGVDLLSVSAHKLYGPKGVGALYIKEGIKLVSLIHGGDQERERRSSTENIAGLVGFGQACEIADQEMDSEAEYLTELRDYFINQIMNKIKNVKLNGHAQKRLPNNINISIIGVEGEATLISLDMKGIALSTGSACFSTSLKPSHVLLSLGLSHQQAHSALRFSLGRWTKKKELDYTIKSLIPMIKRLRKISPF